MTTRQRLIAIVVASALFMQQLDTIVLGTALPAIAASFGVSPLRLDLALTAYLLSLAVFMPLSGWMADRHGVRNVFRLAVAAFIISSLACALAPSPAALIAARAVQGVGGALMVPVARLALLRAVPKQDLIAAMTWVTVPALLGPVVGPALSGALVTYASWPWIFLMNLPIGVLGWVLASRVFDNERDKQLARFDGAGFVLCASATVAWVIGLEALGRDQVSAGLKLLPFIISGAALAMYTRHARRAAGPIVDVSLLAVPTFAAGLIGGSLFRIGIGALPFLLPLMLQTGFGYSALGSGLVTLATGLGALSMKFAVRRIVARIGFRRVLIWNALLSALSIAACALFDTDTAPALMFTVLLVGGFFRSLQFTAVNVIGFADLDSRQMSRATGLTSTAQQLSLATGVGMGATVLSLASSGGGLEPRAFSLALLAVAGVVALSALRFAKLEVNAGAEVAGGRK